MSEVRHRRARGCAGARAAGAVLCGAACAAANARARPVLAQLPGLPAAQSAFPAPGLAVALNGGRGSGRGVGGLAVATGARGLQLTGTIGLPGGPAGFERSGISAGGRLAARLYRTPQYGVSAFAGYGLERLRQRDVPVAQTLGNTTPIARVIDRPVGSFSQLPVGVSAGYRGLFGARPYAVSVAPMYAYSRWKISDSSRTRSGARLAALGEVAVTPRIGVGAAVEVGSGGPPGSPLAERRTVIGAGVSYALQRFVAR